jgi:hypothetical protein
MFQGHSAAGRIASSDRTQYLSLSPSLICKSPNKQTFVQYFFTVMNMDDATQSSMFVNRFQRIMSGSLRSGPALHFKIPLSKYS